MAKNNDADTSPKRVSATFPAPAELSPADQCVKEKIAVLAPLPPHRLQEVQDAAQAVLNHLGKKNANPIESARMSYDEEIKNAGKDVEAKRSLTNRRNVLDSTPFKEIESQACHLPTKPADQKIR